MQVGVRKESFLFMEVYTFFKEKGLSLHPIVTLILTLFRNVACWDEIPAVGNLLRKAHCSGTCHFVCCSNSQIKRGAVWSARPAHTCGPSRPGAGPPGLERGRWLSRKTAHFSAHARVCIHSRLLGGRGQLLLWTACVAVVRKVTANSISRVCEALPGT